MDANKAELVAPTAKLCEELTLISTPGHSPGHVSVHIKSDGEEGLLTGDVAHHPCQMWHTGLVVDRRTPTPSSPAKQSVSCSRALPTPKHW